MVQGVLEGDHHVCACKIGLIWRRDARCVAHFVRSKTWNGIDMVMAQERINMIQKATELGDCLLKESCSQYICNKRQQKQSCTLADVICFDRDGDWKSCIRNGLASLIVSIELQC